MKPHLRKCWCIPPEQDGEFVARMEDILEVYCLPYDAERPVVCMDEHPKQLVKEIKQEISAEPGQVARFDYEYERNGVSNIFLFTEPLKSWRKVNITPDRTKVSWAYQIKELVDKDYLDAKVIRLIMDNLNTHTIGSLYEAFEPNEALRLAERLEIHYTPKHGSWLNIAEIELSVLANQCLNRRIPDGEILQKEVKSWEGYRNNSQVGVDWQFITEDARTKLRRLYPQIKT